MTPFSCLDVFTTLLYFNLDMQRIKQLNKRKYISRATFHQRIVAGGIFLALVVLFSPFILAAKGRIELDKWIDPCGFEQKYGLPCPTCRMTTSALAFVQGEVTESFCTQPAGALLCCVMVFIGFLSFLVAVFGLYFSFIKRVFTEVKIKYIILALMIVIIAGWLVTLARTLVVDNSG